MRGMAMRHGRAANCLRHDPAPRRAGYATDETRLGRLLEQTYAARAARLTPPDDALAKLNVALDALDMTPRRHVDHRRLFGACALVALLLLLLTPVARSEFAANPRAAQRSAVTPERGVVNVGTSASIASDTEVSPPGTVAVSAGASVAPTEGDRATVHARAADQTAPMMGGSETPLRDLLARAGIRADDPASGSSSPGQPPQH